MAMKAVVDATNTLTEASHASLKANRRFNEASFASQEAATRMDRERYDELKRLRAQVAAQQMASDQYRYK